MIFHNQGKLYEVYARSVHQGAIFGFIEIEKFVFKNKDNHCLVDSNEENLKSEFENVTRNYIPMHSIVRIDEVNK